MSTLGKLLWELLCPLPQPWAGKDGGQAVAVPRTPWLPTTDATRCSCAPNTSRNIHQQSPILCHVHPPSPFHPQSPGGGSEPGNWARSTGRQGMLSQGQGAGTPGLQQGETMVTGGRRNMEGDFSQSLCRH